MIKNMKIINFRGSLRIILKSFWQSKAIKKQLKNSEKEENTRNFKLRVSPSVAPTGPRERRYRGPLKDYRYDSW